MSQPPQPMTTYLTDSSWYHVLALLAAQQLKRSLPR